MPSLKHRCLNYYTHSTHQRPRMRRGESKKGADTQNEKWCTTSLESKCVRNTGASPYPRQGDEQQKVKGGTSPPAQHRAMFVLEAVRRLPRLSTTKNQSEACGHPVCYAKGKAVRRMPRLSTTKNQSETCGHPV